MEEQNIWLCDYCSLQHKMRQLNEFSFPLLLQYSKQTFLGMRGRWPSGPRPLCFSSCILSFWSPPSSLPASSGNTKMQQTHFAQESINARFRIFFRSCEAGMLKSKKSVQNSLECPLLYKLNIQKKNYGLDWCSVAVSRDYSNLSYIKKKQKTQPN